MWFRVREPRGLGVLGLRGVRATGFGLRGFGFKGFHF